MVRKLFLIEAREQVVLHVAVSLTEIPPEPEDLDFDVMHSAARTCWRDALGAVEVKGGSDKLRTVFATALYHAFIDPREVGRGEVNGHRFVRRTVFSGWDVYRSVFPMYTLLRPDVVSDTINSMMETMVAGKRDTLPRWKIKKVRLNGTSIACRRITSKEVLDGSLLMAVCLRLLCARLLRMPKHHYRGHHGYHLILKE